MLQRLALPTLRKPPPLCTTVCAAGQASACSAAQLGAALCPHASQPWPAPQRCIRADVCCPAAYYGVAAVACTPNLLVAAIISGSFCARPCTLNSRSRVQALQKPMNRCWLPLHSSC